MDLQNAIALIKNSSITETPNARWADLGCGSGLFTYALANLLQKGSTISAVDKKSGPLQKLSNPNDIVIFKEEKDFIKNLLPFDKLDGILMANSFHYVADKNHFIAGARKWLSDSGIFLIVEYDTDKANPWVPYPVSAHALKQLFIKAGYSSFTKLRDMPSAYNSANIYSAAIRK
jgi:ubiquinone/menaquinone biosynthesis C-methylase UbiE